MNLTRSLNTLAMLSCFALITNCTNSPSTLPAQVSSVTEASTSTQFLPNTAIQRPALSETPVLADTFVDSIGVNTHLSYSDSAYWSRFNTVKSLLTHLGVRHLRDGPVEVDNPVCHCNPLNELGRAGVKADVVLSYLSNQNQQFVHNLLTRVPTTEAFEDPNEVNTNGDANWISNTQLYVRTMYPAIKAIVPNLRVVGPSIAWIYGGQNTYSLLGNLAPYLDFGNIHDYTGGRNPGTVGSGPWWNTDPSNPQIGAQYGSIAASVFVDSAMAGSKPPWATETGFGDAPGQTPQAIIARYEPRLFLEEWLHGVARTYQYQFIDYGNDGFGSFGLVTSTMSPKRNYWALKGLIALLSDPGPSFAALPFPYSIDGSTSSVHHLLMQKRDGSIYLAIWIESEGYNVTSNQLEKVPPQNIAIKFDVPIKSATIYAFGDDGLVTSSAAAPSQVLHVRITDNVRIIKLVQ